jgi:lipid A 3-O-deacylase
MKSSGMIALYLSRKPGSPLARIRPFPPILEYFSPKRMLSSLLLLAWLVLGARAATAGSPSSPSPQLELLGVSASARKGGSEWGWMSGGAAHVPGGAVGRGFWTLELRWGHILTSAHGPGPLRGTLEYTIEIVPAFVVRENANVFGGGLNPFVLQYNFVRSRRLVPFLQAGGGTLFTNAKVPDGISKFNFTPQGGIGVYVFRRPTMALTLGARYHHISNGGIKSHNPGLNSLYFYTGISWWR